MGKSEEALSLQIKRNKEGEIYSHIRKIWLVETPEERVRQEYLCVLVTQYGYSLEQIEEEIKVTGRGSKKARADFLIWKTPEEKQDGKKAFIVVECKADNITIDTKTYEQGANYAQYERTPFFVTHNNRETKYWRVNYEKRVPNYEEIDNIPHTGASEKEIRGILEKLKILNEREFADLLHQCHNVIRNREKKDPAAAFDEIAKILFIKVDIERKLRENKTRKNLFTEEFLKEQKHFQDNPVDYLFDQTKRDYRADGIFANDERVNLKFNTVCEIVRLLERYNLSDTSEDIKGIAFERFLGRTFRGEIGQFFTPRTIVEFMVHMVAPKERDIICDPASGSGGFLIRFFEIVKEQILNDVDKEYNKFKVKLDKQKGLSEDKKAEMLRQKYNELQKTIKQTKEGSRLWNLSNRCIYGTDANDRMARTSKMNMIMHGDGHGGIHHHDGFLNVNGIFEERFDIVLTNPPFGANVEPSDIVLESDIAISDEDSRKYEELFDELYNEARNRVKAAKGKPISSLFRLPKSEKSKIKTEILFIERCLELLKPGGRLGIVLPQGIFNNPSLQYVRWFCEDRAYIKAIVSLPQETFVSAGTSVKGSLLFMQKYTEKQKAEFDKTYAKSTEEIKAKYSNEINKGVSRLEDLIEKVKKDKNTDKRKELKKQLIDYKKQMDEKINIESRQLLKQKLNYRIFIYEANFAGINAVGDDCLNELIKGKYFPKNLKQSCYGCYQTFTKKTLSYWTERIIGKDMPRAFEIKFSDTRRWDAESFCVLDWNWDLNKLYPLARVLKKRCEKIDRSKVKFSELQPITIHFDGSVDRRELKSNKEYTMELFKAIPGDIVLSKIDLKNGAVGIVPEGWDNVAVTSHFAVYSVDKTKLLPEFLHRIVQMKDFKEYLWRNKVGAEGRKEVKLDFFENIKIPVPDIKYQKEILSEKETIVHKIESLKNLLDKVELAVEETIHGRTKPHRTKDVERMIKEVLFK